MRCVSQSFEGGLVAPPLGRTFTCSRGKRVGRAAPHLSARRCAERFDGTAALADDDPFLAFAFDVEHGPNIYRLRALPKLIDLTGDAVRELFMQLLERRFPNELRREEAHRLGGQLVGIIMKGTFRQLPANRGEEGVDTFTGDGRNEDFRGRTVGRPDGRTHRIRVYRDDRSTRQTLEAGYGGERTRRYSVSGCR